MKRLLLSLALVVFALAISVRAVSAPAGVALGIDKYKDLYLLDFSTGIAHHFDSETGIYLGPFMSASDLGAASLSDISVCACGGGIGLLDPIDERVWVVDFTGALLWQKDNTWPNLDYENPTALGICQDSNYEHLVVGTQTGELFHISPPGEPDKKFENTDVSVGRVSGVYMDYNKQVFTTDYDNARVIKTGQWGNYIGTIGEGILKKPTDVATSEDGDRRIWVSDEGTGLLHVFSSDFELLFDCGEGILTRPLSVICDYLDSGCYTAEIVGGEVLIHKFDKDGIHLFTLHSATELEPQSLLTTPLNSFVLYNRSGENFAMKNRPQATGDDYLVEARPLFEGFGFKVDWFAADRRASFSKDDKHTSFVWPDTSKAEIDGRTVDITPKARLSRDKLLLPISFLNAYYDMSISVSNDTLFFVSPKLKDWQKIPELNVGQNLFENRCSKCHNLPSPDAKARSDWLPTVERMKQKEGSEISETDAEKISRYLWGQGYPDP